MSTSKYILGAPNNKPLPRKKQGDGIREVVLRLYSKYPYATAEQIGHQAGVQPELVQRIIDADKRRKLEGY